MRRYCSRKTSGWSGASPRTITIAIDTSMNPAKNTPRKRTLPRNLPGKFLGNVLFLGVFFAGFMLVSMAMVIVRGEAPLQPLVFLEQYLLIAPAPIVYVSALAILFESVPWLSGRFGDVAYFFLFM